VCRDAATRGVLAAKAQLDAVEAKAVQRFTKSYDKLCKTCPTRLQPRVDTLEEMIVGLPEDELKLLAAKVALRLSGHDAAALAGVAPLAAGVDAGMAVASVGGGGGAPAPMGMEVEVKKEKPKAMKMDMEMEMSKADKKRAKLERKVRQREMDVAMYQAELEYLRLREETPSEGQSTPDAAKELLQVPASCEADRMQMEQKVAKRCAEAECMTDFKREMRSLKVQEKILKCTRKMKECRAELSMMASAPAPAPVC